MVYLDFPLVEQTQKLSLCQENETLFTPVLKVKVKVKVKVRNQKHFLVKHQEDGKFSNWG